MDCSETYIKMCQQATEIQTKHKWVAGDFLVGKNEYNESIVSPVVESWWYKNVSPCNNIVGGHAELISIVEIWLPRQDQLQAMVGEQSSGRLIHIFHEWYHGHLRGTVGENETYFFKMTMEQLWLSYIMKELFNKTWNGTEWVRQGV